MHHSASRVTRQSTRPWLKPAVYLTSIYLSLSIFWILISDSIAVKLSGGKAESLQMLQQVKGIFFVLLSGIILFSLSRKFYIDLARSFRQKESLQQKFQALNEAAREGIFDCNLETMTAHVNNKMDFFLPSDAGVIYNFFDTCRERLHPEDIPQLVTEYKQLVTTDRPGCQIECRLLGIDNKYYTVISSIHVLRAKATGKPYRLIGTLLDISELRNLQAQEYEQRLRHKQELTASIIRAQENERNRWAEELHDNVCQLLTVAKLYMDQMGKRTETVPTLLPEATTLVRDAMTEIRQLSASIKPPSFLETSLKQAIRRLASDINRVKDITFSFEFNGVNEEVLTDEQKLLAYRVVQEQLNNIVKYAEATRVDIILRLHDGQFMINIKDDGKGFDPQIIKTGIGLRNIQSRLQHYRGNMEIASSEGAGCTLQAAFEVKEFQN